MPYLTNWRSDAATLDQAREVTTFEREHDVTYSHTEWDTDGVGRPIYQHVFVGGWRMESSP